jgi:L,D-peptidoglycan transpeptidase YkuD (ErfK/YbiS/YcfS/YnhG family)
VRRAVFVTLVVVTAAALVVVARGSAPDHHAIRVGAVGAASATPPLDVTTTAPVTTAPTTTAARATTTTSVAVTPTTTTARHVAPTTNARPSTTAATAATVPAPVLEQRIVVSAASYGSSSATFTAYDRTASGWHVVFGPWSAHIGRNGFAPPGAKREGDLRTPSGTYGFSFFFGIDPDPGVHFAYRRITSPAIVWDDDPASSSYNLWIDTRVANTARTPGLGSAIFLHVSSGGGTAGCVSLPTSELLSVLRWLDPARSPTIALGVGVTSS